MFAHFAQFMPFGHVEIKIGSYSICCLAKRTYKRHLQTTVFTAERAHNHMPTAVDRLFVETSHIGGADEEAASSALLLPKAVAPEKKKELTPYGLLVTIFFLGSLCSRNCAFKRDLYSMNSLRWCVWHRGSSELNAAVVRSINGGLLAVVVVGASRADVRRIESCHTTRISVCRMVRSL
jgi:hypothetical protein